MKHSNWILGLGIIVAVLLIASSLYLKADPLEQSDTRIKIPKVSPTEIIVKNVSLKPLIKASERSLRILLK